MNAAEYRQKAEKLLSPKGASVMPPSDRDVREAAVWARLAVSAATSESQAADESEREADA